MFCRKCGKELKDTDKFCYSCGADTKENNVAANSVQSNNSQSTNIQSTSAQSRISEKMILPMITSIALIFLMLQKWITVPLAALIMDDKYTKFSLYEIFSFIKTIREYSKQSGTGIIYIIAFLILVWFVITLIALAKFCYKLYFDYESSPSSGSFGTISAAVLAIFMIIFIKCLNLYLKSETKGLISSAFSLTACPYIIAAGGIAGKLFVKKIEEDICNIKNLRIELSRKSIQKVNCPKCNNLIESDYTSCPKCGFRFNGPVKTSASWVCSKCNTVNSSEKVFCKDCGSYK